MKAFILDRYGNADRVRAGDIARVDRATQVAYHDARGAGSEVVERRRALRRSRVQNDQVTLLDQSLCCRSAQAVRATGDEDPRHAFPVIRKTSPWKIGLERHAVPAPVADPKRRPPDQGGCTSTTTETSRRRPPGCPRHTT